MSVKRLLGALALLIGCAGVARADIAADAFVRQMANNVLAAAKADEGVQRGQLDRLMSFVDSGVMPNVDFEAVTRTAVGPQWRHATPEQRAQLQAKFKVMLVRAYSGALTQIKDQTVETTKTLAVNGGAQVIVQSEVRGKGEPIRLDYRLEKAGGSWKIIDIGVAGIWLVPSYRTQFAPILSGGGIDALLAQLDRQNSKFSAPT